MLGTMKKRVLVTGATGFIGRNAIIPLIERDFEIHGVTIQKFTKTDSNIIWHYGDLHAGDGAKICADIQPTHLLHFAWHVDPKDYKTSQENDRWHTTTVRLVEAFISKGGKRVVAAGTAMEYDPMLAKDFIREDADTADHNAYAAAKNKTRAEIESLAKENDVNFAWGRIFNLYGPHEAPTRLMPQIINSLRENRVPNIPTGGTTLDYSHVSDVAGAFVTLLDSSINGIVNIASGKPVTIKEIATLLGALMEKPELVASINDNMPQIGPSRVVANISRLRDEVGFSAKYDLPSGLKETTTWWEQYHRSNSSNG